VWARPIASRPGDQDFEGAGTPLAIDGSVPEDHIGAAIGVDVEGRREVAAVAGQWHLGRDRLGCEEFLGSIAEEDSDLILSLPEDQIGTPVSIDIPEKPRRH
jgi:hypothetical protein